MREIETAQAEVSECYSKIFWWDNFDRFVDTGTGGESIHNTPGTASQDETSDTVTRKDLSINR